jgi:hypothetical protein
MELTFGVKVAILQIVLKMLECLKNDFADSEADPSMEVVLKFITEERVRTLLMSSVSATATGASTGASHTASQSAHVLPVIFKISALCAGFRAQKEASSNGSNKGGRGQGKGKKQAAAANAGDSEVEAEGAMTAWALDAYVSAWDAVAGTENAEALRSVLGDALVAIYSGSAAQEVAVCSAAVFNVCWFVCTQVAYTLLVVVKYCTNSLFWVLFSFAECAAICCVRCAIGNLGSQTKER